MKVANEVFENWYNSIYDHKPGEDDIKELFREAFEAGMVSGITFMQARMIKDAEYLIEDYKGFQDE